MKKLYKMRLDFGRSGSLSGVFVADDAEIAKLKDKRVHFGEKLGKHSDCTWTFDDLEQVVVPMTDDQSFIEKFEQLKLSTGYNPLNYLDEEEEDDE